MQGRQVTAIKVRLTMSSKTHLEGTRDGSCAVLLVHKPLLSPSLVHAAVFLIKLISCPSVFLIKLPITDNTSRESGVHCSHATERYRNRGGTSNRATKI